SPTNQRLGCKIRRAQGMCTEAFLEESPDASHAISSGLIVERLQHLGQRPGDQSQRRFQVCQPCPLGKRFPCFPAPNLLATAADPVRQLLLREARCLPERPESCSEVRNQAFREAAGLTQRSEEHRSELQSRGQLVSRLLLDKTSM